MSSQNKKTIFALAAASTIAVIGIVSLALFLSGEMSMIRAAVKIKRVVLHRM